MIEILQTKNPHQREREGKSTSSSCLKYMLKYMVNMLKTLILVNVQNLEVGLYLTQLDIVIQFNK